MDRSIRIITLKILSLTAIFSFLYPALLLLRIFLFRQEAALWEALYNYAIILCGLAFGSVLIGDSKGKMRKLAAILAVIVPAVFSTIIYIDSGFWRWIFETVVCLIVYFFGLRAFFNLFDSIVNGKKTIIGTGLILISLILCIYFPMLSSAKFYILILAHIYLGAVLLISNQSGIDDAFLKRHIDRANIPGKMRRYNSFLVLWLYLIIVILINIKAIIEGISALLKDILINGIKAILWIMMMIGNMFPAEKAGESAQQGQGMPPDLGGESGNKIIPIILNIFLIVFSLIAIYMLFKQMPSIIKNITAKLKAACKKVINFLKGLLKVSGRYQSEEDDYHDEIQTLKIKENDRAHKHVKSRSLQRKGLKGIVDPSEKIKYIYLTILNKLTVFNIKILKSDTTREILVKAEELPDIIPHLKDMTRVYEELKYGEIVPDNVKVTEAEKSFISINTIMSKIKK